MTIKSWLSSPLQIRGADAERAAEVFLKQAGLQSIERNYRCRSGEIDLIMRDGESLVFIEVRMRNNTSYGSGADSVTVQKQLKISRAAAHYLQKKHNVNEFCRFDVVSVRQRQKNFECQWIKSAFDTPN